MLSQAIEAGPEMSLEEAILAASKTILAATDGRAARRGRLSTLLNNRTPADRETARAEDPGRRRLREAVRVIRAFEIVYRSRLLVVG
ncbi:hypothetical protein EAH76_01960 [Sphingomonas glacialis]|uniref:Uncharacterized protein n=2 Tax=Sphingomonas glacialis TaxID=658225 RepID=A0A502G4E6_9SPHN|nr:hypothetical protein EAH76_01960 [Sphingomonas glacialis]